MQLIFREANETDLPELVKMLANDQLGKTREDFSTPIHTSYIEVLKRISADPNNELMVVESDNKIIGMLQITFIPYLTHKGSWRCLIEGVRVHEDYRGKGLGSQFVEWAIDRARQKGCKIVQLTSNKQRQDAIRFYNRLGFEATHEGFKLNL